MTERKRVAASFRTTYTMQNAEDKFIHELEVFRTEAESCAQFFYAFLTIHDVIHRDKHIRDAVNRTPLFWKTNLGALQKSFFITLGRVFDKSTKYNIHKLLESAEQNRSIFSKSALAQRKKRESSNADEWLDDYLKKVHEPTSSDFSRLKRHIDRYNEIYERNYKKIRSKVFAHKVLSQQSDVQKLFAKTNIREMEHIFAFLIKLSKSLRELLYNGKKPILRPMSYSLKSIKRKKLPEWSSKSLPQSIVEETIKTLNLIVSKKGPHPDI